MYWCLVSACVLSLSLSDGIASTSDINNNHFPADFLWGVSNSAYQYEGAWNEDGKSPNIWDYLLHTNPNFNVDGSNLDTSANSYHMIESDIALLKSLNVKIFRTSLPWTRILPLGNEGEPNQLAIQHYRKFFKLLKHNNIEVLVTLYHFDLPQKLADYGGFLNASLVDWFSKYARICFQNFGEDVKWWATFNEPYIWCMGSYAAGFLAPAKTNPGFWEYICGHNLLKAHAAVWHMYDEEFRPTQRGTVSLTIAGDWYKPITRSEEDVSSAERQLQFRIGWFAHPMYHGNYPSVMIENIAKISIDEEGRNASRLPTFTAEEIKFIKGTNDIFLLNTYTAYYSNGTVTESMKYPFFEYDIRASYELIPNGNTCGIRPLLSWIRKNYNDTSVLITENGVGSYNSDLNDDFRVEYLQKILSNIKDAMEIDNSTVLGYTVWSLYDGFESQKGYTYKMGLTYIDFNSDNKTRIPRESAHFYSKICQTGCIVENCTHTEVTELD